jgi:alcohol dehydrogenase (cytochrome c)
MVFRHGRRRSSGRFLVSSGWGSDAAILLPPLFPQLEKVPAASTLIAFKIAK